MGGGARPRAAGEWRVTRAPARETLGGVVIRAVERDDVPAIAAIEQRVFPDPWTRGAFDALVGDPRVFFRVAADSRKHVLGYVVMWFVLDEGEVANVAVAPERRGEGIGRALLDAAIAAARGAGVRQLFLEVRDSNAAARAMYRSRGFVQISRRRGYYRRPVEDALVLRLELPEEGTVATSLSGAQQK